ncbi:DUF99 family protein [Candidatus Woesearchaeota archaeon]|nr:DUF99 family protein [Candidatus Woesearchaeota archaeon]
MKWETRILAFDDAPFDKKDSDCLVVGVFYRGGYFMDGVVSTRVKVDGVDAAKQLVRLVRNTKFVPRVLMFKGVAFAGFNVVDFGLLYKRTGIPVIVVSRDDPLTYTLVPTLEKLGFSKQLRIAKALPLPVTFKNIWFQCFGLSDENAREILRITIKHSDIPEPLRIAHLIAQGVVFGESRGSA